MCVCVGVSRSARRVINFRAACRPEIDAGVDPPKTHCRNNPRLRIIYACQSDRVACVMSCIDSIVKQLAITDNIIGTTRNQLRPFLNDFKKEKILI